jgi:putative ABC transport system substrate-binding protein
MAIRRRDFIKSAGLAAAWPLAARAQRAMPLVGFLNAGVPELHPHLVAAFRKGLSEMGYEEGRNVAIEYRWARNEYDHLPELVTDLIRRQAAVIATPGGLPNALAAKAATNTIPIVVSLAGDPVQLGLVASLNRPGGNVTGINSMNTELLAKQFALLHDLVPSPAELGLLLDSTSATAQINASNRRRRRRPWAGKSPCSVPPPVARSMQLLPTLCNTELKRCTSRPIRYSRTGVRI